MHPHSVHAAPLGYMPYGPCRNLCMAPKLLEDFEVAPPIALPADQAAELIYRPAQVKAKTTKHKPGGASAGEPGQHQQPSRLGGYAMLIASGLMCVQTCYECVCRPAEVHASSTRERACAAKVTQQQPYWRGTLGAGAEALYHSRTRHTLCVRLCRQGREEEHGIPTKTARACYQAQAMGLGQKAQAGALQLSQGGGTV